MERLAARRLCIFNTNFLFLLRRSKVSCNFILKTSKKFSAFKFSPKLWDKPARTVLGPFLRLWSTQTFSALGSSMTSFALVIWAYEQSASALSTVGVLVLLSTDALCVWHLYVLNALNGLINTCAGLAMVIGSVIVSLLPAPKSRTRVICNALLVSMSTENFLLALGHSMPVWCVGAGTRLAAHSADERQLRRAVPHPHSREDAGPRLHRAQFAAILILQRGALSC